MKSDQELLKTFKLFIDKNGVLNYVGLQEIKNPQENIRQSELIEEEFLKIFNQDFQKSYMILLNLLPIGQGSYIASKSRQIWIRLARHKQADKVAIVGKSVFLKVVASFIIQAVRRSQSIKWFDNKEKALEWLKE